MTPPPKQPQPRTMRQIWETSRGYLQLGLAPDVYDRYLRPLEPVSWANGVLTVAAPTEQVREWCDIRLNRRIQREVSLEAGRSVTINYIVQPPHEETPC